MSLSDVTGLRVAESKARESGARFRTLAETIPQLVWQARADGTFEFVNRRWHDYAGTAPVEGTARLEQVFEELTHPDDRERWRAALRHSLTTGEPLQVESRLRGRDGEHRWFLARAQPLRDERGAITAWFCTSTDIDDQKRAERRAHFVAAASEQLALSLDVEVTLRRVARLAVPEFADWCAVDRLDGDHLRRVEVAHPDPRKVALANELMERYPARLDDPAGVGKVVRTREPDFVPDLDARLEALVADQDLARLLRGLQFKSTIIVPMLAGAEAIGAITFATAESDRRLSAADLEMAARTSAAGPAPRSPTRASTATPRRRAASRTSF